MLAAEDFTVRGAAVSFAASLFIALLYRVNGRELGREEVKGRRKEYGRCKRVVMHAVE